MESDAFESPKELLQWVEEDFPNVAREIEVFFKARPYIDFVEDDPQVPGGKVHKMRITKPLPSSLRKAVQRVMDELKKAMDQALFHAIAVATGRPPKDDIWFPWANNPDDLEKRLRNPRIPSCLHDAIREIEPYPRGDGYSGGDDIFREMAKLSGSWRHRTSLRVAPYLAGYTMNVGTLTGMPMMKWDSTKNELTIARIAPNSYAKYGFQGSFYVTINDPALQNMGVVAVLKHLHSRVSGALQVLERAATHG